jgi:hypothetical protein
MSRTITKYPDGTIKINTGETRTKEQILNELSFADKLAIMFPSKSTEAEITKGWVEFDNHKLLR